MRGTYHLCFSSPEEVICRNEEDHIRFFNCIACSILETESRALADGIVSNHAHLGVQTDYVKAVCTHIRYPYSRYFNAKYHGKGRLGERTFFYTDLIGRQRVLAAISYIYRQPMHHGITSTPFEYKHSSACIPFQQEFGRANNVELLDNRSRYNFLPSSVSIPENYRMGRDGLLLREDIIDRKYVEELFITPKAFDYYMTRNSDDKWIQEQMAENSMIKPVTLETIEKNTGSEILHLLSNEKSRDPLSRMTDMELCQMIDNVIIPRICKEVPDMTLYDISLNKRQDIGNRLFEKYRFGNNSLLLPAVNGNKKRVSARQLKRCLALNG